MCRAFTSSLVQFSGISHVSPPENQLNYSLAGAQTCFLCSFGPRFVWHLWSHFCATFILTVFLCHRRIDVSPRAFKKHSQLFEAMKSSEDDAYKVTEHSAVWSMLEAHKWPSQRPLDCILLKVCGFPLKRGSKCLRSAKEKRGILSLLYTAPTWLECGHKLDRD